MENDRLELSGEVYMACLEYKGGCDTQNEVRRKGGGGCEGVLGILSTFTLQWEEEHGERGAGTGSQRRVPPSSPARGGVSVLDFGYPSRCGVVHLLM